MVCKKEVVGLNRNFEKEGRNDERVNTRLADIGNNDPNYDSKFTLNVGVSLYLDSWSSSGSWLCVCSFGLNPHPS